MKLLTILTFPLCALSLAACQTTAINEGAGYSKLTPTPSTAVHISKNDPKFARQVAAHNRQCNKDKACI